MKNTISVYIIFAFLLMSFAGCGKLKSSPVSGLNQSETSTPPEVVSQPDTSASSEVNSQLDTSAPPKAKEVADKKWVYVSGLTILAVVIGASYIFAPPPPPRT